MSNRDVISSHISGIPYDDGGTMSNIRLRAGEVQAAYAPTHEKNVSKRVTEYDVFVSHHENGTAVTKIYSHCYVADLFGGVADTFTYTMRADTSAYRKPLKPGLGSKVLILCIGGHQNSAVILSGIKDMASDIDPEPGHHLHARFQGLDILINNDGELIIERQGPQNADGSLVDGVDANTTGSTISLLKNGNIEIADAVRDANGDVQAHNFVTIDHENGNIEVTSDAEVHVNSQRITHGSADATEPFVLGDSWSSLMSELIDAITAITCFTPVGPTSPPINQAQFLEIKARLNTVLSSTTFSK